MWKALVAALAVVVVGLAALAATFLLGMRRGTPAVVDRVRRFNRAVTNPRVMRSAGDPGNGTGIVHHVGRSTGRDHATPIGPFRVDGDFVVALPYGTRADWVRNVLAAGSAGLELDGTLHRVERPELVPTSSVVDRLPAGEQRTLKVFGVDRCLVLHPVTA